MKKIPTLFRRDMTNNGQITQQYHPAAGWVVAGEGTATRKYDGITALVHEGTLWKRRFVKPGNTAPEDFWPLETDDETGITVGWVPVDLSQKDNRWFAEALEDDPLSSLADGTYELIGPRMQGNPEKLVAHELVAHADAYQYTDVPTDFFGLREWLREHDIEGIVWHHPDGRMAKIKGKDFGLKREDTVKAGEP